MTKAGRIVDYAAFWPYYLSQHAKPATRAWHIAGTGLAAILVAGAAYSLDARLLLAAILAGYGPAWMSHAWVEQNRPATFAYPVWSLISDIRMTATWLSGGLSRELTKAGIGVAASARGLTRR